LLIIFDLDDTLIDTSGCITPFALERTLHAMIAAGLHVSDFIESLEQLKRINSTAISSKAALQEFLEICDGHPSLFDIGKEKLCGELASDLPVFLLEGASELLSELIENHELALVTGGKSSVQMEKLKKAGIDSTLFSNIVVAEDGNKKIHYKNIAEKGRYMQQEVLVCGDRIPIDLAPAKELGFKTVHMRWGRGLWSQGKQGDVDYQITSLNELKEIISHLMTFSAFL
jgi:putative hydrolase of the HAD superfamily